MAKGHAWLRCRFSSRRAGRRVGKLPTTSQSTDVDGVDVLGVRISAVNPPQVLDILERWIATAQAQYVCVTGVHGVMECQRDPGLLRIHNRAGLTVPDGMPMVWAGHWAGATSVERVYGPDLMRSACARGAQLGWRSFLYGSTAETNALLRQKLEHDYPGLKIVGSIAPPFRALTDAERAAYARQIDQAAADIVWVGLSTPKQEREMAAFRPLLNAPVLVGVGAAFDLVSGKKKQAPPVLQKAGLEWAFRLAVEPRRLWRRYARNNPAFVREIVRRPPRLAPRVHGGAA